MESGDLSSVMMILFGQGGDCLLGLIETLLQLPYHVVQMTDFVVRLLG